MKKILILLTLLLLPAIVFARFEPITNDLEGYFSNKSGIIVSGNETIIVDLGKKDLIFPGEEFDVLRGGEQILHPITGKVLGTKSKHIGRLVITEVNDDFSFAKAIEVKSVFQPKDLVKKDSQMTVQFDSKGFSERHLLLLREEVARIHNLKLSSSSSILLNIERHAEGGISVGLQVGETKVFEKYYSDINDKAAKQEAVDMVLGKVFPEDYHSLAVGDPYGDGSLIVALAAGRQLDLYRFTGESFEKLASVDGEFTEIINIEFQDMNKNGKDELLVSHLEGKSTVSSKIFEYNKKMELVKDDVRLLFRTLMVNGKKKVICQNISKSGRFLGGVYFFGFKNGAYGKRNMIPYSAGKTLYGFGYGDVNNDGKKESLWIDYGHDLVVYTNDREVNKAKGSFGHTSHYILMGKYKNDDDLLEDEKNRDDYIGEAVEYKQYIRGRIFVTADPVRVYVANNIPIVSTLKNTYSYKGASVESLAWKNGLTSSWKNELIDPEIMDYEPFEQNGNHYMIVLRQQSAGFFSGKDSQLMYVELK